MFEESLVGDWVFGLVGWGGIWIYGSFLRIVSVYSRLF